MSIFQSTVVTRQDVAAAVLSVRDGIRVLAAGLDLDAAAVAVLAERLSPVELERARRCHFERDRRRFIVARAWLRGLLGERLGVPPEAVALASGEHGKPMLAGGQERSGWQFNLSRCGDLAVLALSSGRRVGIDVEAVRDVRGAEDIAAHFFSRCERTAYRALEPHDRTLGFLNCWTRKEAFVKALGTGMSYGYDRFDVSLAPRQPARLLRVDGMAGEEAGWRLDAFAPRAGFVAALVSEGRSTSFK